MEMRWVYLPYLLLPPGFAEMVGGHPIVARELWRRGLRTPDQVSAFLDPQHYQPASPFDFPGMTQAVSLLEDALTARQPILVWGDFDVDGQTSTSLLVSALRALGANVTFHIPIREKESHGIKPAILQGYLENGVSLLLTCDTGITAFEAIELAREHTVKVIITDHHIRAAELPPADAIINPHFLPASHPAATLPGVGVAYMLIAALKEQFAPHLDLDALLDLVSLGIVADVASLTQDTRFLLQKGLPILRQAARTGLKLLYAKAGLDPTGITPEVIGFQVAPRLNAIGRLADANPVVELLLTADEQRADLIATQVEGHNHHRQLLVRQVLDSALKLIEQDPAARHDPLLILHHPAWPSGIIGIVASHLVERFHKPTILLTGADGLARGSARSIPDLDITAALASQQALLSGFGGHAAAAGLSLPLENLPLLRKNLNQWVNSQAQVLDLQPTLEISASLALPDLSLSLVREVERLAPFGSGNPAPVFVSRDIHVTSDRQVGREQEHRQLILSDDQGNLQKVIWWNGAADPLPPGKFDLAYTISSNTWRGEEAVSLTWVDALAPQPPEVSIASPHLVDHRPAASPLNDLQALQADILDLEIWAEGHAPHELSAVDRFHLKPAATLALWSVPPSNAVLKDILAVVKPQQVHVFAQPATSPELQSALQQVAGMLKYALNTRNGAFSRQALAAATGLSLELLTQMLLWLQAKGIYRFENLSSDSATVHVPGFPDLITLSAVTPDLEHLWAEFQAYQHFFTTHPLDQVFA